MACASTSTYRRDYLSFPPPPERTQPSTDDMRTSQSLQWDFPSPSQPSSSSPYPDCESAISSLPDQSVRMLAMAGGTLERVPYGMEKGFTDACHPDSCPPSCPRHMSLLAMWKPFAHAFKPPWNAPRTSCDFFCNETWKPAVVAQSSVAWTGKIAAVTRAEGLDWP